MFRHTVCSDSVDIEAPVRQVWEILADVERYGEWNPFTTRVDTSLEVGSSVDLYVSLGPFRLKQPESIQDVVPPSLLAWGMTMGARWFLKPARAAPGVAGRYALAATRPTDAFAGRPHTAGRSCCSVVSFGRLQNAMALALKERAEEGIHS